MAVSLTGRIARDARRHQGGAFVEIAGFIGERRAERAIDHRAGLSPFKGHLIREGVGHIGGNGVPDRLS